MNNKEKYHSIITKNIEGKKEIIDIIREFIGLMDVKNIKILDFGCANGSLTAVLAKEFKNATVYGYDIDEDTISLVNHANMEKNIHFVSNLDCIADSTMHFVVMSSVLHEVFSYGDADGKEGYNAVINTLTKIKEKLCVNGSIIIRDGIKPISEEKTFNIKSAKETKWFLNRLRHDSPFGGYYDSIHFYKNTVTGNLDCLMELFNKQTWGKESFDREKNEIVNFIVYPLFENIVNNLGFKIVSSFTVKQKSYYKHLSEFVTISKKEQVPTKCYLVITRK